MFNLRRVTYFLFPFCFFQYFYLPSTFSRAIAQMSEIAQSGRAEEVQSVSQSHCNDLHPATGSSFRGFDTSINPLFSF